MGRRELVEEFLTEMGGLFGHPEIAEETIGVYEEYGQEIGDPTVVAWNMFLELLDAYDASARAFEAAWNQNGVIAFAMKMGLREQDAEDISQKVAEAVWKQIYNYKPWRASWNTWVLAITKNQVLKFLRDSRAELECEDVDDIELEESMEIDLDEDPVEVTCRCWINSPKQSMRIFGAAMLFLYRGWDWFEPTSEEMVKLTGFSRTQCLRLFQGFAREVRGRANQSGFRRV